MNLLKSLAAVSSMTMFSRVLGFARDAIVARIFGAGMATDAFFVAFKLPNLLRRIFAEGAFSQAFVPILAEYKSKQGEDATRVFVSYVSGLLTLALAVVTVAGMLAAPWVIMVTATIWKKCLVFMSGILCHLSLLAMVSIKVFYCQIALAARLILARR